MPSTAIAELTPAPCASVSIAGKRTGMLVRWSAPTAWAAPNASMLWDKGEIAYYIVRLVASNGTTIIFEDPHVVDNHKFFPLESTEVGSKDSNGNITWINYRAQVIAVSWDEVESTAVTTSGPGEHAKSISVTPKAHKHGNNHSHGKNHSHSKNHSHGKQHRHNHGHRHRHGHKHYKRHKHNFNHKHTVRRHNGHNHGGATNGFSANPGNAGQHNHIIPDGGQHLHGMTEDFAGGDNDQNTAGKVVAGGNSAEQTGDYIGDTSSGVDATGAVLTEGGSQIVTSDWDENSDNTDDNMSNDTNPTDWDWDSTGGDSLATDPNTHTEAGDDVVEVL